MSYIFVCNICGMELPTLPLPTDAVRLSRTVFRFTDGQVHSFARRKLKPERQPQPDRCRQHWTLNKADCEYCRKNLEVKE